MNKAQPRKMPLTSMNIAEEKRDELKNVLKQLLPEAVNESGIDFDQLKRALGEWVEPGKERFGLTWPGKAECMKVIQAPSVATLKPTRDESVNFDTTENLFIEGDNLEVLKLLQKSYFGKVKMIYIDPPYNTGKEFIYPDKFAETLDTYLEYTGQKDSEGRKFSTNTDAQGRYHSRWLSMMHPRLYLARNLLREDGVIFISIDDHEQANLRALCDQIFGDENFIVSLAVQLNPRGRHLDKFVAKTHESILVYGRDINCDDTMYGVEKSGRMVAEYDREDEKGKYRVLGLRNRNQAFNPRTRPNLFYPLYVNPETLTVAVDKAGGHTEKVLPVTSDGIETCWTWGKEKVLRESSLLIAEKQANEWRVFRKDYLVDESGNSATTLIKSLWTDKEINNDYGRQAIKELFGESLMDFPKAPELIQKLINTGTAKDDVILDFFAGSGTAAQAVMQDNKENGSNRKFILVQLPEPLDEETAGYKAGYKTIADIAKERIRRVINKIKITQDDLLNPDEDEPDLGFKVFKLARSNFNIWEGDVEKIQNLEEQLSLHVDHIAATSTPEDILYELLLKSGFPLTTKVEKLTLAGKEVFSIEEGAMLICLDNNLTQEVIDALADANPLQVICLDEGFRGNDQLKANAVQTFKARAQEEESEIVFRTV